MLAVLPTAHPAIENPAVGQHVPVGDQCPTCGVLLTFWLYNPFLRNAHDRQGWHLWRNQHCDCQEPRRTAAPDAGLAALDRLLNRQGHRALTFATFPQARWRRQLPAYRVCADYARRTLPGEAPGLCLCGPPSDAREHLAAALVNADRALACPTALVPYALALQLLAQPADVEAFRPARLFLHRIPVLAITGLFADPATPTQLKAVHRLLHERSRQQRCTHVTMHRPPAEFTGEERSGPNPLQAQIALLVERLCLPPLAVPA